MDLGLNGKVAVVTGGSSGIGRAIVQALCAEGVQVVVVDRDPSPDDGVHVVQGDLTDADTCARAAQEAVDRFGAIDVLVNNAGRNDGAGLDASSEAFVASLQTNLVQVHSMARACRAALVQAGGSVVNIGSKVAVTGQGGTSGYAAAKGGVMALTREWALELAPHGVRVNALCPVAGETPLLASFMGEDTPERRAKFLATIPLGRFSTPEDMGHAACYLCSDEASMITGVAMEVDGGRCI